MTCRNMIILIDVSQFLKQNFGKSAFIVFEKARKTENDFVRGRITRKQN
jgi:hypothetical protein